MRKTHLIIVNIVLLLWYFLSMIGLKIGDKYLVTGAFEEEWVFMLIPTITFVLMLVTKNVGRNIHLIWLAGWFVTQFLSHEWYTLFGRGFMGEMDKKIAYFSECIQLINVDGRYFPDVYHIVLHILIIVAFVVTLLYREEKTLVDEV
jgi:hypothetical protein